MPKIDGSSLRRKLNNIETLRKKSVPFLFYPTSGEEHIVQQAYSPNIQDFFKKPTNISEYKLIFEDIMSYWTRSEIP